MNKMLIVILCIVALAGYAIAQGNPTYAPGSTGGITGVDKLGAHSNGGRGCTGCHAPHSGGAGAGGNAGTNATVDPNMGNFALWGQDMGPLYGKTLGFGDNGQYQETLPALNEFAVGQEEISGIMTCLSCHDGNIAKGAMMTNQSWEQKFNLLPKGANGQPLYGSKPIPTLLGNEGYGGVAGNYNNDHPVGRQATLGAVGIASRLLVTTCGNAPNTYACLDVNTAKDTNAAFATFMQHYGAPQLIPGRTSFVVIPEGDTNPADAYVVCTTCHTPHSMYTYSAGNTKGGKIAGNTSGVYPSYFFINAPYNPGSQPSPQQASSATQFCRQCHFTGAGGSNEGSGIMNVTTAF